jgi:ribosomal protein S18 acetylase RimI-like enzyme
MIIQIRKYRPDDLPALADVINRAVTFDQQDGVMTLEDLRNRFERPYFDPQDNCLIAVTADQHIAGYCTAELDPRVGQGWGEGHVDPDCRRQGIGRALLRAADDRHRERADTQLAPELPMIVTRYCGGTNTGATKLFESEGYQIVRVSWSMEIDLAGPIDAPPLPEGVTLRPFVRERDAYSVYEAVQTMFRDHWGFIAALRSLAKLHVSIETPGLVMAGCCSGRWLAGRSHRRAVPVYAPSRRPYGVGGFAGGACRLAQARPGQRVTAAGIPDVEGARFYSRRAECRFGKHNKRCGPI